MAIYFAIWAWFCGLLRPRAGKRQSAGASKWGQMLAQARTTAAPAPSPWTKSTNNLRLAFILAAAWTTLEWLRGWVFSGFGWNGLGVALHDNWPLIQITELTGVAGLSFMVAFANVIVLTTAYRLVVEARTRVMRPHFDFTVTMAAIVGVLIFGLRATQISLPTKPLRVAAVQSNVPQNQKFDPQFIAVVVLDRPNPINGVTTEGPVLDPNYKSFVGMHPLPVRHGRTIGELAQQFRDEAFPKCELSVLPMKNWQRAMWFDQTGLPWVMPSPNMPTLETATVYPGMCLFEGTNISEGRGTTRPFEIFGAPFINAEKLCTELNSLKLPGVFFRENYFQPTFQKFAGQLCGGAQIHVIDRNVSSRFGREWKSSIHPQLNPEHFQWKQPPYEYEWKRLPIEILIGGPIESDSLAT